MEIFEEIVSYADNELKDQLIIKRVKSLIEENCVIKNEYMRQIYIKELLQKRFCKSKAPKYLIINISKKINEYINSSLK